MSHGTHFEPRGDLGGGGNGSAAFGFSSGMTLLVLAASMSIVSPGASYSSTSVSR